MTADHKPIKQAFSFILPGSMQDNACIKMDDLEENIMAN